MRGADERGFSLVEVLVSIMVIGVAMVAFTAFFVNTTSIANRQRGQQAAIQLADDAVERVRTVKAATLPDGRTGAHTDGQWSTADAAVTPYLSGMVKAYDASATTSSVPVLPFEYAQTVNGVEFTQHWYLGTCWQAPSGGDCGDTATLDDVRLFRVVVAVTWADGHCSGSVCAYVTPTLVSGDADPVFNSNDVAQGAVVNSPGAQVGEVSAAMTPLQLTATGGAAPLTWSASGLPDGLQISSSGLITGTPTGTQPLYTVTATATDGFGIPGSATFDWAINPLPQLTSPGDQASTVGRPVTLPVPLTGGTPSITWTATGLPVGLTINASTGVIAGTPTTATASPVTVTVTATDAFTKTATATFKWQVNPVPVITQPGNRTTARRTSASLQLTVTGGTGPFTWAVNALPNGLSINSSTGLISGTTTNSTSTTNVTVTATDSRGSVATVSFTWTIS